MTDHETTAYEDRLMAMSETELRALWDAVNGEPTNEQMLTLGEMERRNMDL
ncbi:hypothetical protein [Sphingomonas prati]|uniref:Uncharacterized protein n=1 Tax=Sphingomonas prati TaxID=1843237 RepID=A0A7W9BPY0_9SPHN|nr:hypothetical protein [Sphingomonas prati]MBB5727935.1 hypothetical protein [Sphingomonas prati]GGE81980.1 hypothetical protein GCM10011404_13270 [Sphingomonas prati]